MPVVLIADKLAESTVAALGDQVEIRWVDGPDRPKLLEAVADADALLVRSATTVDAEVIGAAPKLKIVARAGVGQVRGPVRDAATVFDENALLIQTSDAVWLALTEHRWLDAFLRFRSEWAHTCLWAFGHAALEKAVQPYKSITVHLWRVPQGVAQTDLDAWLAQDLTPEKLARKPFSPLPLLGVPGWWLANEDPAFYADASVFRPLRSTRMTEKPYANPEITPSA